MKMRTALRILLLALAMLAFASVASADVFLPASLTAIEAQAFMNASWLSGSCVIPEGVTTIGAQAFAGCSGITSLTIPDSVTSIGAGAFSGCSGITGTVIIPEGCVVAEDAFTGCSGLTVVYLGADPAELFTWSISGGEATITGYKGSKDVTSVAVPFTLDGCPVTAIGDYAFSSCRYLTHISLPSTVRTVGDYAFAYSSRLTSVSMPIGVTELGRYAFYYCSAISGEMVFIDATIPSNAFTGCKKLSVFAYTTNEDGTLSFSRFYGSATSVSVPKRVNGISVTAIGREAFSYRTALQEVSLPSGITSIGQSAFYYCSALRSITIPYGVTSIGPSAFYNCTALQSASIPSSVSSIGSMAFYNCTALNGRYSFINATVNASAFNNCTGVEAWCYEHVSENEVALASCISTASALSVPATVDEYEVVTMKAQAFYSCKSVTAVSLPATFTAIPEEAFYRCTTLKSISIPEGVKSIGASAFYGCTALESITIPAGVSSIGQQAFYNCTALATLVLQDDATQICSYAFAGCTALEDVSISGDCSNVGNLAFNNTPWLNAQVSDIALEVTAGCSTDYEKALALHDWLVYNTAYDNSYTHYGSEGVLFHGTGVCNAYTLTYSRMLSAVGISSMTVTGTATDKYSGASGSHAWTLAQLDGTWYHIDTTWDDPIPDGRERHTYFCLTDAQMAADHTWDTSEYPAASGSAAATAAFALVEEEESAEGIYIVQRDKSR